MDVSRVQAASDAPGADGGRCSGSTSPRRRGTSGVQPAALDRQGGVRRRQSSVVQHHSRLQCCGIRLHLTVGARSGAAGHRSSTAAGKRPPVFNWQRLSFAARRHAACWR